MIKYLRTAKIEGKTVLVRVDMNEPVEKGKLQDDFRIRAILPTIKFLQERGCKIILCGHLGRPEGQWRQEFSLMPLAQRLGVLLGYKLIKTDHELPDYPINHLIFFTGDITNPKAREQIEAIPQKDIILLENIRFYKEEEEEDGAVFAKQLASLADLYVNEAFSVSHRKEASVHAITKYLPSYAGLLLEKEIKALEYVITKSGSPLVLMMGGIKISDKAKTLEHLGKKADSILLAGGLANLFFLSKGYEIGLSKVEKESQRLAWQMEKNFKNQIVLPQDVVVANKAMDKSSIRACLPRDVKKDETILDIGPKTILEFAKKLKTAKTIVWNGPMGYFEQKPFRTGTMSLAKVVGAVSSGKCFTVVGGGETVDAVRQAHQEQYIDHVSTGGGAMLEFLAGEKLPGIEALNQR